MSQQINKLHYAVVIETKGTVTNHDIGLDSGVFRYITDFSGSYTPVGNTYEDLTPVTGVFYGDILTKASGIKPSKQSIDIIVGGDYAFLSTLQIELVNFDGLHKSMTSTDGLYLVGSKVSMYVIIDNVWYSRWVGNISEYEFEDETFTIQCKDKNNADNSILSDYIFGENLSVTIPVAGEDINEIVLANKPINSYYPATNNLSSYCQKSGTNGNPSATTVDSILNEYNGMGFVSTYTVSSDNPEYIVDIVGVHNQVKAGMYLKLDKVDELFYISEASQVTETYVNMTRLKIVGDISTITDTTQLYGFAKYGTPTSVANSMKVFSEETLTCSVVNKGVRLDAIDTPYPVYDVDKLDVFDKDGNALTIRVQTNPDGSVTILNREYIIVNKPKNIYYWSDNDESFKSKLDNGTATDLDDRYSSIAKLPQDLDVSNPNEYNYFITNTNKYHYFVMEFDSSVKEGTPFTLLSSLANSTEVWSWETFSTSWYNALYSKDLPYNVTNWTTYNSPYVSTDAEAIDSRFRAYWVTTYRIIKDDYYGDVPLVVDDYLLPNTRTSNDVTSLDPSNRYWKTGTVSINATNLPISTVNGDNVISSFSGVRDWGYVTDANLIYPIAKLAEFESTGTSVELNKDDTKVVKAEGNKIMIMIQADNPEGISFDGNDSTFYIRSTAGDVKKSIDHKNMKFGVNSMGLYTTVTIESPEDITVPIIDKTTNTVQKVISDLSGKFVDLPNRVEWYVAGQIEDENKFNVVTTLCKQSFIAGYSDRFGESQYITFLEGN